MLDVAELYRTHGAMVHRRARRLLRDDEAARDVVHDVFLTLTERPPEQGATGMVSWLYVVTTNLCLKRLRSAATRARLVDAIDLPRAFAASGEVMAELRAALAGLPQELASLAVYRFVDEMTHAEIAELMGCSRRHIGDLLERFEHAMQPVRRHNGGIYER
jgi:RNA polymerase sigma factor (sigma-70 family)